MINDINIYTERMSRSIDDKLDFWSHLKPSLVVDFGCADGSLIKELANRSMATKFIGYDLSWNMLELAKHNLKNLIESKECSINLTSNWGSVLYALDRYEWQKNTVLNLSSVIHEVYNMADSQIGVFWEKVFNSGFDYIVIRDMMFPDHVPRVNANLRREFGRKICSTHKGWQMFNEFESYHKADMNEVRNFVHFLTKFKFVENWESELKEDYFRLSVDRMLDIIRRQHQYNIEYLNSYTLPYLRDWVKNELDYDIPINTHCKIILKKRQ